MEYSLQSLTKQTELNEITLENIVNKLIGLVLSSFTCGYRPNFQEHTSSTALE